jgi:hypothetical protein
MYYKYMAEEQDENLVTPIEQDNIDSQEYSRSLEGLRRFSKVDTSSIQTLEDLSAKTSLVGHDLHTVILAKGGIKTGYERTGENPFDENNREEIQVYALEGTVGDHTIIAEAMGDTVVLKMSTTESEQPIIVRLPSDRDIAATGDPLTDMFSIGALVPRKDGSVEGYFPARSPKFPNIQQDFAHILQKGVKDALSIVPEPTKVPEVFNY